MEAIDSLRVSEDVVQENEHINEDGRVVDGVNTTVDVAADETQTQAAKFGNAVDAGGIPPSICETGETPQVSKKSPVPTDKRPGLNDHYRALFSRKKKR